MKSKQQVLLIHGGNTYRNRAEFFKDLKTKEVSLEGYKTWSKEYLDKELGRKYQVIRPQMPLGADARYEEWKVFFKKYIPLLKQNVILIGNSLGGIFLAKYLSENKFPKKIKGVFLVCPTFDNSLREYLGGGFKLKSNLARLDKCSKNVFFMFSKDDDVVPVSHAEKYRAKLPHAQILIYKGKNGHFRVPKFPELIKLIKSL